jgi:hypothetical protein
MKKPPARLIELKRVEFKRATGTSGFEPTPTHPNGSQGIPRRTIVDAVSRVHAIGKPFKVAREFGVPLDHLWDWALAHERRESLKREERAYQLGKAAAFPLKRAA